MLVGVVLAVAIVGAVVAGIVVVLNSNEKVDVLNPEHSFGDTIRSGDVEVRVNEARLHFTPALGADAPPPGQFLVTVDITVRNVGSSGSVKVATAELVDLVDAVGSRAIPTAITELAGVDGTLDANQSRRGFVAFIVADTAPTPLRFRVKGTLTGEPATFKLS